MGDGDFAALVGEFLKDGALRLRRVLRHDFGVSMNPFRALQRRAERRGRGYPDWYLRYVPALRRVRAFLGAGRPIIEIGANENGLARFVAGRVIAVDISLAHLCAALASRPVLAVVADASRLPFRDGVAGVCASFDTLEHVPEARRAAFCRELVRVTAVDGAALLAFPSGAEASAAEATIRAAYARHTRGGRIRWLEEHLEAPLPDAGAVAALLAEAGAGRCTEIHENAPLWVWRGMWRVLMCGAGGRLNPLLQWGLYAVCPVLVWLPGRRHYRAVIYSLPSATVEKIARAARQ